MEIKSNRPVLFWMMLLLAQTGMHAQLMRPGKPLSPEHPELTRLIVYSVEAPKQEGAKPLLPGPMLKPARSGLLVPVHFTLQETGLWDTLQDGTRVWRAGFHVPGAGRLSLVLSPYRVSRGVRVFAGDRSWQKTLGAFSDLNNHPNGILATGHIPGDLLVLEIQVPPYVTDPGEFTISGIGCDFNPSGVLKQTTDEWFGISGICNTDIACTTLSEYQQMKDAVVRIVYLGDERCTGTLMNNARNDGRNYILTAGHCITSESVANTAVFYFGYESPYCDGPDGSSAMSVSGATLRASGDDLDFALLELLEPPPYSYRPYYAGWDRSLTPPSSGYTIHHPLGDVKKISVDEEPITVSTFSGLFTPQTHWKVSRWASGTTEAGSSGAGLFDPDNRLRGSLTGGEASCSNSVNDYFQMFSHSWKDYPEKEKQLAWWLDPLHSDLARLDGYDPYAAFRESGDTLTNIQANEPTGLVQTGLGWGSWSGHNSGSYTQFAEPFQTTAKKVLGVFLDVVRNHTASVTSRIVLKLWSANSDPGEILAEKEVFLADLQEGHSTFVRFDSAITIADSFFAGYTLFYENPQDTFALTMASDRSVSGISTAWVFDGEWVSLAEATGGQVVSSFAIRPLVYDSVPAVVPPANSERVKIYPNPVRSLCQIEFSELKPEEVRISVYDLQGNLVESSTHGPYQRILYLDTSGYRSGVYLITVNQGNNLFREKLVIMR